MAGTCGAAHHVPTGRLRPPVAGHVALGCRLHAVRHGSCSTANTRGLSKRCMSQVAARHWAVHVQCASGSRASQGPKKKKVVVVGAGWAGFGAAKHLAVAGYDVTLLDAELSPGGLSTGWRTEQGRAVEAGMKGFWYEYHNIFALVRELGIPWPFTPWTRSGFWSPAGLVTEAPVFSSLPRWPTMLGQFVHTLPLFRRLSLAQRATMLPLLAAVVDYDATPATYARYDSMSAAELFRRFRVDRGLYEEFLRPLLLVGLFAPPEQLSAGAMMATFYFYALAHQESFDICWCKGSVAELIFQPLIQYILGYGGRILGGHRVRDLELDDAGFALGVRTRNKEGLDCYFSADAVVFAVGVSGMQKIVLGSPELAARQEFRNIMSLKSVDVIAVRLWFDKLVKTRFPANVLSGFDADTGSTYFNLNELQDEYKDEAGSVIAADFYHAGMLLPLSDAEIVARARSNMSACDPGFASARVVDSAVLRFPKAVTQFSPGSYAARPTQRTSFPNVCLAGDWIKGLEHGASGLSQERAYVTGLAAANLVVDALGTGAHARIIPVIPDEPPIAAAKAANRLVKSTLESLGVRRPFL